MKFNEYSHFHGKELLKTIHPEVYREVISIITELEPFNHGEKKGWQREGKADFKTDKEDFLDLCKWKIAIEMEYSRFEMFFRDFFRFMLLYEKREIDVGIIITLDQMAYKRWAGEAKSYERARASLDKLIDFLKGDYSSIVKVPLWCIGIE